MLTIERKARGRVLDRQADRRTERLRMELRVQRAQVRAERIKIRERRLRMLLRSVIADDPKLRVKFVHALRLTTHDVIELDVATESELMAMCGAADDDR